MPWLIDSDILIEGERQYPDFVSWLESADEVATRNVTDFAAMGCPCQDPLQKASTKA